jgi:hypothetical protein
MKSRSRSSRQEHRQKKWRRPRRHSESGAVLDLTGLQEYVEPKSRQVLLQGRQVLRHKDG